MARINTTIDTVLARVVDRLIQELDLHPETCFVALHNEGAERQVSDIWITVAATDGEFDAELFHGGGEFQVCERVPIVVTIYSSVGNLDVLDHADSLNFSSTRGLRQWQRRVLRALLVDFDLSHQSGSPILRSMLAPYQEMAPIRLDDNLWSAGVVFAAEFDWDLHDPDDE